MSQEVVPPNEGRTTAVETHSRRWVRRIGLLLVITAVLLAYFLIVGLLGYQSGQRELVAAEATALANGLARQVELAQTDVADGRYALAQERLSWVLALTPAHSEALTLQQMAQQLLNERLTPVPTATSTPSPTPTPMPTSTLETVDDPTDDFAVIGQLVAAEAWEDVINLVPDFQRQFPSYERPTTDKWLYDAYIALGLSLMDGEQVELGLFYLGRAERLGNLPPAAEDYQTWAELYLQGLAFYGTNWAASAYYFRDLCLAAPFYQNACERLYAVLIAHGDQYAVAQDWCPAQTLYEEARRHRLTSGLTQKLEQAVTGCLSATPTPSVITQTVPITNSEPFIAPIFVTPTAEP